MAKQTIRKSEVTYEADPVELEAGPVDSPDHLANALLILTALCLLIAVIISWTQLGHQYKAGLFGG